MKNRIIQSLVVVISCLSLLAISFNKQEDDKADVYISIPVVTHEKSDKVTNTEKEKYVEEFTTFLDADYYDIVDDSIVSKDSVESIDNYIKNEIDANSYNYVRVVGFGYNPTYHESSIELVFDSNEYRYIIVSDSNPNDISIIYNYTMTDFQLSCLGLKED